MLNKVTSLMAALQVRDDATQTEMQKPSTLSTSMHTVNAPTNKYASLFSSGSWKPEKELSWSETLFGKDERPSAFQQAKNKHFESMQSKRGHKLGQSTDSSKVLTSQDGTLWTGSIYMGTENKAMDVVFDTGSDWLLVEGSDCASCEGSVYDPSTSTASKRVGAEESQRVQGAMQLKGTEYTDTVCVTDLACIEDFEYFLISEQTNMREPIDGFLGLARNKPFYLKPEDGITRGPSFMMALENAGLISSETFSFSTAPARRESIIDFGEPNERRMRDPSELQWINLNEDFFWSAQSQGFAIFHPDNSWEWGSINGKEDTVNEGSVYSVFDSGSPAIIFPKEYFGSFLKEMYDEMGGDEYEVTNGFVYSKCYEDFPAIYFLIDGKWIGIYPEEYVLDISGNRSLCVLLLSEGEQPFFVFGTPIYMNYYTIHDSDNNRLGFVPNKESTHFDGIIEANDIPSRVFGSGDPSPLPESAWSWIISSLIVMAFMCFWCCLTFETLN